ncbi:MAG TPA: class I SAM-dependent methyltransferase [Gaiellaceae bacterium]|nr:class I SAM-dependent methyltransferase [Gaiellaceae bacterium]
MTTDTHPGTAAIQGPLWSERADDWAELMEPQMKPAFEAALDALEIGPATRLLDVGCGSGLALRLAADRGADVTGLDASEGLLAHARRRLPGAPLVEGEIEHLPFTDGSFDIVTGFNSFQYAARPAAALTEAARVLAPGGRVLYLNWAPPEQCEAAAYLAAIGKLLPAPPPGAPGPFALSDADAIVRVFDEADLDVASTADVTVVWNYPNKPTAIAGLMASGPIVRAIQHAGEEATLAATAGFLEPFRTADGGYRITNVFRYAIGDPR